MLQVLLSLQEVMLQVKLVLVLYKDVWTQQQLTMMLLQQLMMVLVFILVWITLYYILQVLMLVRIVSLSRIVMETF